MDNDLKVCEARHEILHQVLAGTLDSSGANYYLNLIDMIVKGDLDSDSYMSKVLNARFKEIYEQEQDIFMSDHEAREIDFRNKDVATSAIERYVGEMSFVDRDLQRHTLTDVIGYDIIDKLNENYNCYHDLSELSDSVLDYMNRSGIAVCVDRTFDNESYNPDYDIPDEIDLKNGSSEDDYDM